MNNLDERNPPSAPFILELTGQINPLDSQVLSLQISCDGHDENANVKKINS
jgi:hypothetical protein